MTFSRLLAEAGASPPWGAKDRGLPMDPPVFVMPKAPHSGHGQDGAFLSHPREHTVVKGGRGTPGGSSASPCEALAAGVRP